MVPVNIRACVLCLCVCVCVCVCVLTLSVCARAVHCVCVGSGSIVDLCSNRGAVCPGKSVCAWCKKKRGRMRAKRKQARVCDTAVQHNYIVVALKTGGLAKVIFSDSDLDSENGQGR